MEIIKIVLDVMSPAQQSIVDLVSILNKIDGVAHVDVTLSELEKNVEDFKVLLEGDIDFDEIRDAIKDFGAVIRNVDNVVSGDKYIPKQDLNQLAASILVLARHLGAESSTAEEIFDEFEKTLNYIRLKNNSQSG